MHVDENKKKKQDRLVDDPMLNMYFHMALLWPYLPTPRPGKAEG